jgi:hypothetical protein
MKQNLSQASVPSAFPDGNTPSENWWQRINWPFLCAFLWGIAVWTFIVLAAISLCSCATKKELYEHHSHHIEADTLAQQAQTDTRITTVAERLDSLFALFMQREYERSTTNEDSRETITETITTSIDSLGRQLRTEQRTIDRTLSRQEQHDREQWQQQMQAAYQRQLASYDSLLRAAESRLQTHWEQRDSTNEQHISAPAATQPWYRRLWNNLQWLIAGAILAAAIWITRRWWRHIL